MFLKQRIKALEDREVILENRINELLTIKNKLVDQVDELKLQNKRLSTKKQMEEEQIAHKLQMREEECDINYRKKIQEVENNCAEKIRKNSLKYRDKVEKHLEDSKDEIRTMYSQILERLPDVSVMLKGKS